jgi:futalosine hydrolase
MQILVVSATVMEIAPFIAQNLPVDYIITGVGSPACMYHLVKKMDTSVYDIIIQAGIAGSFSPAFAIGTTLLVEKDVFADVGVLEAGNFKNIFDLGFADANEAPYAQGWLVNKNNLLKSLDLPVVDGITVNLINEDKAYRDHFVKKYNPVVESMEGAALHYVCLREKINFLQLRTISNEVGERDKSKWKINEAIDNLNKELLSLLEKITS